MTPSNERLAGDKAVEHCADCIYTAWLRMATLVTLRRNVNKLPALDDETAAHVVRAVLAHASEVARA